MTLWYNITYYYIINSQNMNATYITVKEAAEILGTNPRQIKKLVSEGKLLGKNINASGNKRKIYRILKEDLLKPNIA